MNKIEIRNKHTNKVIFEYECEDNTTAKDEIIEAEDLPF